MVTTKHVIESITTFCQLSSSIEICNCVTVYQKHYLLGYSTVRPMLTVDCRATAVIVMPLKCIMSNVCVTHAVSQMHMCSMCVPKQRRWRILGSRCKDNEDSGLRSFINDH